MAFNGNSGAAARAAHAISRPERPNPTHVCGCAADHVARAREALGADSLDPAQALQFLDEAISCLKGLTRPEAEPREPAGSAVLPFSRDKHTRSA